MSITTIYRHRSNKKIESFLQVHSFPTYKIVDKQGNILDIKVDARSLDTLEKS